MKHPLRFLAVLVLALAEGLGAQGASAPVPGRRSNPTRPAPSTATAGSIRIATFNIQNFGPSKAARPEVMAALAAIIQKFDVVAVQEVSDSSGRAPRALLDRVNSSGPEYGLLLSERTGKQTDDRTSQEAYAFYYRKSSVAPRDAGTIYPDEAHDYFQREPYVAGFVAGARRFVLITIHTRPEAAVEEIGALAHVIEWARTRYPGEDDFVALGDFNGSGNYARPADLIILRATLPFLWVVPDNADTNVSASTALAYDRIIITNGLRPNYRSSWGVDRAYSGSENSYHWPVWFELRLEPTN